MASGCSEKAVKGETTNVFRTGRYGFIIIDNLPSDERGITIQRCGPGQTMMAHVDFSTEIGHVSLMERK